LLSIFYVRKEEKQKQKKKIDKGPNGKKERKEEGKKERYLCSQVSIFFQDSEERCYFQVWNIVELDFHLFLSISFIPHHFSHHIKPYMHILI
jgi:hypothetical protein